MWPFTVRSQQDTPGWADRPQPISHRVATLSTEARRGYIRVRWPLALCPTTLSDPEERRKIEAFQAMIVRTYSEGVRRGATESLLYLDMLKLAQAGHGEDLY